jgi:hypothetical protein
MPMDASTGLVGKKCKSRFNGDGGFFNSRILAYFSDRLKRKGSPLRSPLASQTYLRIFRLMILSPFGWISQESIRPVEVALIRLQPILARY